MAKLNDVKVLDMKDGKVTKIRRGNVDYELTEEKARVGDVVYYLEGAVDQLKDEYYEVAKVDEYARVEDEGEKLHGWKHHRQGEYFEVFRKQHSKWAKIGREDDEYKKGDIVRVLEDNAKGSRNKKGDIGEIDQADVAGTLRFYVQVEGRDSESGNDAWHSKETIELISPVEKRFDKEKV